MAHGDELAETADDSSARTGDRPIGPGDAIGRYRVQRVLGQGGMGVVYAAHDPDLDRSVALKVLRGTPGDEARTRLLREARAMAKLSHPNVITVYEVGSAGAIDFVAMELIEGKSLADWLTTSRDRDEVLRIFRAAARGLAAAHAAGLVHRDFKPANVLLGRHDRVVVTDFGLARAFDDLAIADPATLAAATTQPVPALGARTDAASLSSTLTRTGALLGTPAYMAPEQFAGVTAGPRSDQYAFAVALWEALTGARPFQGKTVDEIRRAAQEGAPAGAEGVPRRLRPILLRGMARDPADRFPDLGALLAAIDRAERRPRTLAILATGGAAAIAAAVVVALLPAGDRAAARAPAPPCPDGEAELARGWAPGQARSLATRLASAPGVWRELEDGLDRIAAGWRVAHAAACALPAGPARDGELSCLALVRDQLAAAVVVAGEAPPATLRPAALLDEIDDPASCRQPLRARPALPADPAARDAIAAIRVDLARALMQDDVDAARALVDRAAARARELEDPAALAEAQLAAGVVAARAGDFVRAEAMFDEAAIAAETVAADGLRAAAAVAIARSTAERSSDVSRVRAALTKARAAVTRAGEPPLLLAHLDDASALMALNAGDLDASVLAAERARLAFDREGAARSAIGALRLEAKARNQRDRGDDVARATELLADAIARAVRVYGDDARVTRDLRKSQAWILADHDPARAIGVFASLPRGDDPPPGATPLRGRVVGPDGRPRAGAVVHVGKRLLALADGTMITAALERDQAGPRSAATDTAGRFTVPALPDDVVIVAAGELRSVPTLARDLPATVTLRPTHRARLRSPIGAGDAGSLTVLFTVADGAFALDYQAITHRIDAQTWEIGALPDARALMVVIARVGRSSTEYLSRRFVPRGPEPIELTIEPPPPGVALEVVVRGDRLIDIPGANVFVITGRELAGRTIRVRDFDGRALRAPQMFGGYASPADPSAAPSPDGQPGDLRLRIPGVPPGPATACVLPFALDVRDPRLFKSVVPDTDELELHCRAIDVPAGVATHRVVVETPAMQRQR